MCEILKIYPDLSVWLGQKLHNGLEYVELFAKANELAAESPYPNVPTEDFLHILTCHAEAGIHEYTCEYLWPELSYKLLEYIAKYASEVILGEITLVEYHQGKAKIVQSWLEGEGNG